MLFHSALNKILQKYRATLKQALYHILIPWLLTRLQICVFLCLLINKYENSKLVILLFLLISYPSFSLTSIHMRVWSLFVNKCGQELPMFTVCHGRQSTKNLPTANTWKNLINKSKIFEHFKPVQWIYLLQFLLQDSDTQKCVLWTWKPFRVRPSWSWSLWPEKCTALIRCLCSL